MERARYRRKKRESKSRPRSIYGQQYPCPAFLFFPDFQIVSRAAVPEGQFPVEGRGYFVNLSVRPSVRLSVQGGSGLRSSA